MRIFIALLVVLAIQGCANPGIVQMSPDTFVLNRVDKGGIFGNAAAMQSDVIREAYEFAAKQGKVAVPVSTRSTPMAPGQFATFEYQFRVVDRDSPEARRAVLKPLANVVIENQAPAEAPREKDVYTELIKLDDLRKRGVLTDAEFEIQKKKLLSGN